MQYYNFERMKSKRKNKLNYSDQQPKQEVKDDPSEQVKLQPVMSTEQKVSTTNKENFLKNFNGNYNVKNSGTFRSNYKSL